MRTHLLPMLILWLLAGIVLGPFETQAATPQTRSHGKQSLVLHVDAPASMTLAAFTPTQEAQWNVGWNPAFSRLERANEEGSVFTTSGRSGQTVWLLDRYDRSSDEIRYVEVQPQLTLSLITVIVTPGDAKHSVARVTYEQTSLSARGDRRVNHFLANFASQRAHWEHILNEYLRARER